jgi:hypothetical protein
MISSNTVHLSIKHSLHTTTLHSIAAHSPCLELWSLLVAWPDFWPDLFLVDHHASFASKKCNRSEGPPLLSIFCFVVVVCEATSPKVKPWMLCAVLVVVVLRWRPGVVSRIFGLRVETETVAPRLQTYGPPPDRYSFVAFKPSLD